VRCAHVPSPALPSRLRRRGGSYGCPDPIRAERSMSQGWRRSHKMRAVRENGGSVREGAPCEDDACRVGLLAAIGNQEIRSLASALFARNQCSVRAAHPTKAAMTTRPCRSRQEFVSAFLLGYFFFGAIKEEVTRARSARNASKAMDRNQKTERLTAWLMAGKGTATRSNPLAARSSPRVRKAMDRVPKQT
jgi:hypothetical protein